MAGRLQSMKRWLNMLLGKSVFHMQQKEGLYYEKDHIKGYYSDLRHKVSGAQLIDENGVPYNQTNRGDYVYFPITIFQYGLGAYDLYLETGDSAYKDKFICAVKWAAASQEADGSWNAFGWQNHDRPYSSMAQSEGASLLCRAYVEEVKEDYLNKALKATTFMLRPVSGGGCAIYENDLTTLEENMTFRTILNGMIFSVWGLYDVYLLSEDAGLKTVLDKCVNTLEIILPKYDRGYWSNYDQDGHIASPFYHDLHIEQLKVMSKLFGNEQFKLTQQRWEKYQNSWLKGKRAFVVKAFQKLQSIDSDIALVK